MIRGTHRGTLLETQKGIRLEAQSVLETQRGIRLEAQSVL